MNRVSHVGSHENRARFFFEVLDAVGEVMPFDRTGFRHNPMLNRFHGLSVAHATERTREQFQWLAAEIVELEGEALVWEAALTQPGQAEGLARQFLALLQRLVAERQRELKRADELQQKLDAMLRIERSLRGNPKK